ncbi:hypothetical protein BD769DRAFT_1677601 [Suillus cothurnatus]|nr:hypothetical protein BD769DRAFT_1677601 [Suillus cothurnatus]
MLDDSDDFGNVGGEGEDTMVDGTHNKGNEVTECYPDPLLAYQDGYTFLSLFDSDENSVYCKNNLYLVETCPTPQYVGVKAAGGGGKGFVVERGVVIEGEGRIIPTSDTDTSHALSS